MISRNICVIRLVFALCAFSCVKPHPACKQKDQVCDSADVIIGNKTNHGISFSFGSNTLDNYVSPGKSKTFKGEKVKVTYDPKDDCMKKSGSSSIWTVFSDWGVWAVNVDHCEKRCTFKYDTDTSGHVSLYDESEN